jgi:hypothetical protein
MTTVKGAATAKEIPATSCGSPELAIFLINGVKRDSGAFEPWLALDGIE